MAHTSAADYDRGDRTYRFGGGVPRSGRSPVVLLRAMGRNLKSLIQAVADAKVRRMLRELEYKGGHLDMRDELWTPDASRTPSARHVRAAAE